MPQHLNLTNKLALPRFQYPCFLSYDAISMAHKIVKAYSAHLRFYEFESLLRFPTAADSDMSIQLIILESNQKRMTLITPLSGNNIYSDYLDSYGEGFHHNCTIFSIMKEHRDQLNYLINSGYKKIQIHSYAGEMESCILKEPCSNHVIELLYLGSFF